MSVVLFVRIRSGLAPDELERRVREREPRFRDVPGLVQKIYGRDPANGDVCGIYFFESRAALEAFRGSELAKTIGQAYEPADIRREAFDFLFALHPDRGPFG